MLHFVYFDGTSAWVGSESDSTKDTMVVFKSLSLDKASDFADEYNENL